MLNSCGSCLAAPFVALWRLLLGIINLVGRAAAAILGLLLVVAGLALSLTIVGAVVGIPLIILGVLLMARSIM